MTNISETASWVWNTMVALCVYETLKLLIKNIWLRVKILTSLSDSGQNVFFFIFISSFSSFGLFIYVYFFDIVKWEIKLQTENVCNSSSKEYEKHIKRTCHVEELSILTSEKHFQKLWAKVVACLSNYQE